jgi:putative ABC transport system permease protein
MRHWIERSMKADLYLASAGAQSASSDDMISPQTVATLRASPEVAELAVAQSRNVQLIAGPARIMGVDAPFAQGHDLFAWVESPGRDWWTQTGPGDAPALINESYSVRYQRRRGDVIELPTMQGVKRVRIVGVYADYGNERGSITLNGPVFAQWLDTPMAWRVAVMLKPGADAEAVRSRWRAAFPGLSIFSNSHLRSEALRIFRQTFSVTYAVEVIGVAVAVGGLCLALVSLFLERRPDLLTLQALGMTRREMAWAGACEGAGVAWAGVAQGLVAGVWLGWLLIARINKQCFGWTLTYDFPWAQIAFLGVAVVGSGALVAAMVGRWGATLPAEREE